MYSWREKLIDWINQRGDWTRIGVAVGIAVVITAIILAAAMPSKSLVKTNAADIGELRGDVGAVVNALGTKASKADLDLWSQNVSDKLDAQARDITGLRGRIGDAENNINDAKEDIESIQDDMAKLPNSPPEAHITGTFGDYTLHVESSEGGNFTANVHLVYSPPLWIAGGNTTAEETLAGFSTSSGWVTPTMSYNGTVWAVTGVAFNIGTFSLMADIEKTIDVSCTGLNSTYEPAFVYVEVHRI